MNKKAIILFNKLSKNAKADEKDVLDQVELVSNALTALNYEPIAVPLSLNLKKGVKKIKEVNPDLIFNLVESINNKGRLLHFSPALLDTLGIPYTGSHTDAIYITTNKVLAKKMLLSAGLPTSKWFRPTSFVPEKSKKYILKPIWEEGSLDLDESSVFDWNNKKMIDSLRQLNSESYYIEEFIDGREFNISILASKNGPQVLHPAEIQFIDYPNNKPKVVGYTAKWNEESFEYQHTQRTFSFEAKDGELLNSLKDICIKTWETLNLRGYVRVDFRIDNNNNPYILEVNANPCISPDSGFIAACEQEGIGTTAMVKRIVEDALR